MSHLMAEASLRVPPAVTADGTPVPESALFASVTGVDQVKFTLTFDPPWEKDRMSDEAKLTLNMF